MVKASNFPTICCVKRRGDSSAPLLRPGSVAGGGISIGKNRMIVSYANGHRMTAPRCLPFQMMHAKCEHKMIWQREVI